MPDFNDLDKDRDFLMWIHDRLHHVYGENELIDYMHRLRAIIEYTPAHASHRCNSFACNGMDELKKALINKQKKQEEDERPPTEQELRDAGMSKCEQCNELAWDGRICHACGMKKI